MFDRRKVTDRGRREGPRIRSKPGLIPAGQKAVLSAPYDRVMPLPDKPGGGMPICRVLYVGGAQGNVYIDAGAAGVEATRAPGGRPG